MKSIKLFSKKLLSDIEVMVERKKIKNVRLRVLPTGIVKLSVPFGVSQQWIDDYLPQKIAWIEKALDYFKDHATPEFGTSIQNGSSIPILGRQMRIVVNAAKVYKIEIKKDMIYMQSPVSDDPQAMDRQWERWIKKQSKSYFLEIVDRLYPIIAQHGCAKPKLQVRKMKTRWGSCSPTYNKINLNTNLYKAPPECIDYVVLHELSHLLYPRHNKDFYGFLTVHMPDWQERKRILNTPAYL